MTRGVIGAIIERTLYTILGRDVETLDCSSTLRVA